MVKPEPTTTLKSNGCATRRDVLAVSLAAGATLAAAVASPIVRAATNLQGKEIQMTPKAFVYTELQISVPFGQVPWQRINESIRSQPGFLNKTWLYGASNSSVGGIYAFDTIENAQAFVTGYFPGEAAGFGVAHNTRVFDAAAVEDASRDMGSPHFGTIPQQQPGAFVYTEVQVNVPFDRAPWKERNPVLRQQEGLIAKTWLSGLHTNTLGGLDAFDTLENATKFAVSDFPETARKLNAAFYTRIFDATVTEQASRDMHSPYYA